MTQPACGKLWLGNNYCRWCSASQCRMRRYWLPCHRWVVGFDIASFQIQPTWGAIETSTLRQIHGLPAAQRTVAACSTLAQVKRPMR